MKAGDWFYLREKPNGVQYLSGIIFSARDKVNLDSMVDNRKKIGRFIIKKLK